MFNTKWFRRCEFGLGLGKNRGRFQNKTNFGNGFNKNNKRRGGMRTGKKDGSGMGRGFGMTECLLKKDENSK